MRGALAVIIAGLAGCAEPAIEMHLALPSPAAAQGFDVSCVSAVAVSAVGRDAGGGGRAADQLDACVDLSVAPRTFADIPQAVAGRFALGLPRSGLVGVALRGLRGRCSDATPREPVFYGGAPRDGDQLSIPIVPNLSCDKPRSYTVSVTDLANLAANHSCLPPIEIPAVFAADIHPRLLGDQLPRMTLEAGPTVTTIGAATVDSFAATADSRACVAVGFTGLANAGVSCVNLGAPTLCASTGQVELATLPLAYASASRDPGLVAQYGEPVFGTVWHAPGGTSAPLPGATVELTDPSQGKVFYVEHGANQLTRNDAARATTADAWFVAYIRGEPAGLIVRAAGHVTQTVRVASTPELPATVLVVLPGV